MMGTREYAELLKQYKFNGNPPEASSPISTAASPVSTGKT